MLILFSLMNCNCIPIGVVGVWYQIYQEWCTGHLRPTAYISWGFTSAENYPTHQLEFLALKWAALDKLKNYLYGAQSLTYILLTGKLDVIRYQSLAALS